MLETPPATDSSHQRVAVVVYLDGACPYCRVAGSIIRGLDIDARLRVTSYRSDASFAAYGLSPSEVDREMHVVILGPKPRVVHGFDALLEICRQLWLCRPAMPVLHLLRRSGLGNLLYRLVAQHRPRR